MGFAVLLFNLMFFVLFRCQFSVVIVHFVVVVVVVMVSRFNEKTFQCKSTADFVTQEKNGCTFLTATTQKFRGDN